MKFPLQELRKNIPWYIKFGLKIMRGSLPFNYNFFANLGFFRHGKMDDPESALAIFNNHFKNGDIPSLPFVFLELGPGDSLFSGIIAFHKGASSSYLVDHGEWVSKDIKKYLLLIKRLFGEDFLNNNEIRHIEDIKRIFKIHYLTNGVQSLKEIPSETIDLSFSNAVLEHVYAHEVRDLFKELRRISKKKTLSSHFIDFKDHLSYSLNNLRFSEKYWEKEIIKKSGIYTNRLRFSDMKNTIESSGFTISLIKLENWEKLPLSKSKLDHSLLNYNHEDLLIKEAWVRFG
jgi:hypothetical protein